eukprot:XP_011679466.1 PREDICTED: uncharacterized protein LOC105445520 isoform X1 [Strongylocentrotus purpuratus]
MYQMENLLTPSPPSYLSQPKLISPSSIAIISYEPDFSKAIASIIWSRHRTQTTSVIFKCNVANCPLCPSEDVESATTRTSKRLMRSQRRNFVRAKRSVGQKNGKSTTALVADFASLRLTSARPWMLPSSSYSMTSSASSSRSVSPSSSIDVNSPSVDTMSSCKLTSFLSLPSKRRRVDEI